MDLTIKINDLNNKISTKQAEIRIEQDVNVRHQLYKQLIKLQLRREIEMTKKRMEDLS